MQIIKRFIPFLFLLSIVFACGGYNTKARVDEVFDVHDAVMPKMGEVINLKRKVLEKAQIETDSIKVKELRDLAQKLDNAGEGMMVWMREWSKNSKPHVNEESDLDKRKAFFAAEMEKVTKVKDDINNAIAAAKQELK